MSGLQRAIGAFITLLLLAGQFVAPVQGAEPNAPADSGRQTTLTLDTTEYEWWLLRWSDNQALCRVFVDHAGLPLSAEVLKACGPTAHNEWINTPPCKGILKGDASGCAGLYLHLVSSYPKERQVLITLPEAEVELSLQGCTPQPPANRCETLPGLTLQGIEPLPNERIIAIHGIYDANPFTCSTVSCTLPLRTTPLDGTRLEFWADSSYGDSSRRFSALIRVLDSGVSQTPGAGGWYVDVLSSQWRGAPLPSCAAGWAAFPPVGGLPGWLSTPSDPALLASDQGYYYLAGRLISQGVVDASTCATGGLLPNGYADACGLEQARPAVEAWQNMFDPRILEVSKQVGVPAQLLKNLFAQESQFWPGMFRVPFEFGLGQITDQGADILLQWGPEFYDQFCPLMLTADACAKGYLRLNKDDQALLRGALAGEARADCADCPAGIDLTAVDRSLTLFASTVRASCEQVGQIVYNATGEYGGRVASYEDLWRFTVANYHGGAGCLSYAVHTAWAGAGLASWDEVSTRFTEPCRGVIPYVDKIAR